MAAITHRSSNATTTGAASYASTAFTPAVGDLLIAIVTWTATITNVPTSFADNNGGTYVLLVDDTNNTPRTCVYVRTTLVSSASSTTGTVTHDTTNGTPTGNVIEMFSVAGMGKAGLTAIRQYKLGNGGVSTPAITFNAPALSDNPTVAYLDRTTTSSANATPPTGWTERADTGYSSPTTGVEYATRDSGFSGSTITWASAVSSGSWFGLILEIAASDGQVRSPGVDSGFGHF